MLDLDAISRLNMTTQNLAERCKASHIPLQCLDDGLRELTNQSNWSEHEIAQVKRAVLRAIGDTDGLITIR